MTNDSDLFLTSDQLQTVGGQKNVTDWSLPDGAKYIRLYEGKYVWHYNHRSSSYHNVGTKKGRGGRGLPEIDIKEYQDSNFRVSPRYWISEEIVREKLTNFEWSRNWLIVWRDVANAKVERSMVPAVIPWTGVGNTLSLMLPKTADQNIPLLMGNLSSLITDYFVRQKLGGTHLNHFVVKQVFILPPYFYTQKDRDFINNRVVELVYSSIDIKEFAEDMGHSGEPFYWDPKRRSMLQAELDAYYGYLYGLTREELLYILDPSNILGDDYPSETFRVLKEKEIAQYGEYRTQRLVLEAWDRFEADGTFANRNH